MFEEPGERVAEPARLIRRQRLAAQAGLGYIPKILNIGVHVQPLAFRRGLLVSAANCPRRAVKSRAVGQQASVKKAANRRQFVIICHKAS
jgi:hypothetical protein